MAPVEYRPRRLKGRHDGAGHAALLLATPIGEAGLQIWLMGDGFFSIPRFTAIDWHIRPTGFDALDIRMACVTLVGRDSPTVREKLQRWRWRKHGVLC